MGSVNAQHYNISCYACYHKLYLHEHIGTLSCSCLSYFGIVHTALLICILYINSYIHTHVYVYMHVLKLLHSTVDVACKQTHTHTLCNVILDLNENMANIGVSPAELAIHTLLESKSFYVL